MSEEGGLMDTVCSHGHVTIWADSNTGACPYCECDSLRARIEELEEKHRWWQAENSVFRDKIEELERQAVSHVCQDTFTEAQIDAAVEWVNDHPDKHGWVVLHKLGIERCERCEGRGVVDTTGLTGIKTSCPDCNGHGWVKQCASE
jgi:hypothetical protein